MGNNYIKGRHNLVLMALALTLALQAPLATLLDLQVGARDTAASEEYSPENGDEDARYGGRSSKTRDADSARDSAAERGANPDEEGGWEWKDSGNADNDYIAKVEVHKDKEEAPLADDVYHNLTEPVEKDANVYLNYYFELPNSGFNNGDASQTVALPIPEQFTCGTVTGQTVSHGNDNVARWQIDNDSGKWVLSVTYLPNSESNVWGRIEFSAAFNKDEIGNTGHTEIPFTLGKTEQTVEITFKQDAETVTMGVTKTLVGGVNDDNIYDWLVTLTPNTSPTEGLPIPGIVITDEIEAPQEYVDGSFVIKDGDTDITSQDTLVFTKPTSTTKGNLTYTTSSDTDSSNWLVGGKIYTITYKTKLNPDVGVVIGSANGGDTIPINNTVKVTYPNQVAPATGGALDTTTTTAEGTSTQNKSFILFGKHGTIIGDFERGKDSYITWSFTFNESKIDSGDFPVSITDVLDFTQTAGNPAETFAYLGKPEGIKIKAGKILIDATNYASMDDMGTTASTNAAYYELNTTTGTPSFHELTIKDLEKLPPNTYTIAFKTKVDDRYFYNNNNEIPNDATLHVDTTPGTPGGDKTFDESAGVGTSDNPGDVGNSMVAKSAVGIYNAATRRIQWKITLNGSKSPIWGGKFTDTIPKIPANDAQKFITENPAPTVTKNDTPITEPWDEWLVYDSGANTLIHDFKTDSPAPTADNPSNDTYVITYETEALNPAIWGINGNRMLSNDAVLEYTYTPAGGSSISTTQTVSDNPDTTSKVIAKKWMGYDYKAQTASWDITFNQNGMPIDGCVITDTIPAGQRYSSFELTTPPDGITRDDVKVAVDPPTSDGSTQQTVTFTFAKQVAKKGTITVKTKVISVLNQGNAIDKATTVTLKNDATIKGTVAGTHFDGPTVNATGVPNLATGVVNKKGVADVESCSIKWTVELNKLGLTNNGSGDIAYLIDNIPNNLTLIGKSVKLYSGTVDANGTATKGDEVTTPSITLWHVDANGNKTTQITEGAMEATSNVRFEFSKPLKEAYILEFTTVANQVNGNYNNSVSITGLAGTVTQSSGNVNGFFPDYSSEGYGKNGSVTITKQDAVTDKALEGAEFTLRNNAYGYDVANGTTNADGQLTFGINGENKDYLYLGIEYELIETKAPEHYVLTDPSGDIKNTFKLGSKGDLPDNPNDAELIVTNTQGTDSDDLGSLTVTKVDAYEPTTKLSGATFTLKKEFGDNGFITPTTDNTGSNGQIVFDNLSFGEYTLTETGAPDGYTLPNPNPGKTITVSNSTDVNGVDQFQQKIEVTNAPDLNQNTATVIKKDAQTDSALPNATFRLIGGNGSVDMSETTNEDGKLMFSGLPYGSYTLTETAAPTGYTLDTTAHPFTLSSTARTYEVELKNDPSPADVIVQKLDAEDGRALEDVQFTITDVTPGRPEADKEPTLVTGANGKTPSISLPWGDYELRETRPLAEYVPITGVIKAFTVKHGTASPIEFTVENTPNPGDATITKLDAATNNPLAGAVFQCYDKDGKPTGAPQKTLADGIAKFSELAYGDYTIKETKAPPAFELNPEVIRFKISGEPDHKHFAVDFSDAQILGDITLTKVVAGQPDKKLEGAMFQLRDAAGTPIGAPVTTGADGIAKFESLPHGDYVISEEKAPSGYQLAKETLKFKIPGEAGKVDFAQTVENTVTPSSGGGGSSEPSVPLLPPREPPKDPNSSSTPGGGNPPPVTPTEPPVSTPPDTPANGTVEVPPGGGATVTTPPTNGTVTVKPDTGDWTYTPSPGYQGTDSFTITVNDKDGKKVPKTVLVTIEEPEMPLAKGNLPVTGDSSPAASLIAAAAAMTAMLALRRRKSRRK